MARLTRLIGSMRLSDESWKRLTSSWRSRSVCHGRLRKLNSLRGNRSVLSMRPPEISLSLSLLSRGGETYYRRTRCSHLVWLFCVLFSLRPLLCFPTVSRRRRRRRRRESLDGPSASLGEAGSPIGGQEVQAAEPPG